GIETPDPLPLPTIPVFDANPERIRIDSDGQVGASKIEVTTGATLTNVTGVLDYAFRTYTILPDASAAPTVSGNIAATPVPAPTADELTIASMNLERFFDTVDDPAKDDVTLTVTAFNKRMDKLSMIARNILHSPDIIGVEEMENLATLQAIADRLNN